MERTDPLQALRRREAQLRTLLLQGLAGDRAAYEQFLKALAAHLRAYLRRRLASWPDDVEDLVQESLLAVHRQRHTYESNQPLTAWVQAIARYKLVDWLRARAGRQALDVPLDEDATVFASSEHQEAAEARRDLGRLLEQLPERQRAPIVHVKLQGLSVVETAQLTGQSESAVKVNVHRGLRALAARIRGRS